MNKFNFFLFTVVILLFLGCKEENYITYHQNKINANLHLINKQFDSAQIVFDDIFDKYPKHFYKDIHNACLCAIQQGKYDKALDYAKELVLHAYEMSDFEKYYFTNFRNSQEWNEFEEEYPELRKKYLKKQDYNLRDIYYKMSINDQQAAKKYGTTDANKLYNAYYTNAKELYDLYKEHGLPNFLRNNDTLNVGYMVLFRHYFGMKNVVNNSDELKIKFQHLNFDSLSWSGILKQELQKGNVSPEFYSQVIAYQDPKKPFGKCAIRLDFKTERVELFAPLSDDKAEWVNKNRYEIGLMPYVESNSDMLKSTWYAEYPFKEVKQAYAECDSCKTFTDYMELKYIVENEIRLKYETEDISNGFLFENYNGINEVYLENFNEYQKNLVSNDIGY
ncbi:hypothetical protein ACT3CE_12700 [Marinifilum sp. RC60d5]|uniref:hypothetical protein n=1 Tax=Marinifilum sp. RC60d5 TaxID=3458414 RepID=UPI0040370D6A